MVFPQLGDDAVHYFEYGHIGGGWNLIEVKLVYRNLARTLFER